MNILKRRVLKQIKQTLAREKSVLLLGARQTGKTTLVNKFINPDISLSFAKLETKFRYEKNPVQLEKDLSYQIEQMDKTPLVFIDEVQKIPVIMDSIQYLIDNKKAQFILSGSSARKLKHGSQINLLPGRIITTYMDPLIFQELHETPIDLDTLLCDGSLPGIIHQADSDRENDLANYVMTYLEEEVRQEALVRNVSAFSQFLELAAIESGNITNFTRIAQDIGVSDQTIKEYYQILGDCLIAFRINPITETSSRRNLLKSPKYLMFDLGVRRLAAHEGRQASIKTKANWFEQFVGLELLRLCHIYQPLYKVHYWRDYSGVEIDYIINTGHNYIPIEVKWNEAPQAKDARHIKKYINEYENCHQAYIICRTPTPYQISENITALPWQELHTLI